jgi:hypothetical protein
MKRFLLIAAAAALLASPVIAQSQKSADQPKGQATQKAPAVKGANDVWCGGTYLGSDPDPKVRMQILRDYKHECE